MGNLLFVSVLLLANPKVGFGIGQTLGENLLKPSLFTMRIGIGESFIIAPEVDINYSSQEAKVDSLKDSYFTFDAESNFHYAFSKTKKTGFYGIFGLGTKIYKELSEWYEKEFTADSIIVYKIKETTNRTSYGINLGLGIEQFITKNLSFSISSLSNITMNNEKREKERKEEKETIYKSSGYSFDFQNLKCNIYLIWYL